MSDESDLVGQMRALGGPADADTFTLEHDGARFSVAYSGGSSSSLTLRGKYDELAKVGPPTPGYRVATSGAIPASRPLAIVLRPENSGDVRAKREGVSVEWQTGDEEFDPRVYVETDTTEPAVLSSVLNADVRAAVLALVEAGFLRVCIDDDDRAVTATIVEFTQRVPRPTRGAKAASAFAQLLKNLPALAHVDAPRPDVPMRGPTRLLAVIGIAGWAVNVGYVGLLIVAMRQVLHIDREPTALTIASAIVVGIVAGIFAARAYGGVVRERVRGRSNAHSLTARAQWAAFGGVSVMTFTVALIAATALLPP